MKKLYLLLPLAMLTTLAIGQIDFTFEVDMNGETVSADGVHVAGDWQTANGGADWSPGADEMLDGDADGIYTLTINVPEGGYRYKFINGNTWDGVEDAPAVSEVGFGDDNRYFQLTANGYSATGAIVFGGSAPAGMKAVKVQVDLPDGPNATGAFVAGDLFDPVWTADATPLYNVSNNIYAVTYPVADGNYSYKFLNGDVWEDVIPDSCSTDGNRTLTIAGEDLILEPVCFNACGSCGVSSSITISVDMTLSCIDLTTNGVNLMGGMTDWGTGAPMNDDDQDGIWEITVNVQAGDWEYKFKTGDVWEGVDNRVLTVVEGEDQVLEVDCWNSTVPCSSEAFAPSDVTFTVNLADSTLEAGEFAWLMGDFTNPSWQNGAIQMTDNGDGTWSHTVVGFCPQSGRYKFAFGVSSTDPSWTEENAEFQQDGGCGEDNGSFPDNRVVVRTSEEAVEVCFTFNTCDACIVGIAEEESLNRLEIYPNPVNDVINIVFDQYAVYTVRMMDISGKVIYSNVVNTDKLRIENNTLVSGVYFVQIVDSYNNTITKKIIVK